MGKISIKNERAERFTERFGCKLFVLEQGEHFFHTVEQLDIYKKVEFRCDLQHIDTGENMMKNFFREYPLFFVCGLNCGLCTMHIGGYCPGCGGGEGNQSCAIARCSVEHGAEFCSLCGEYPCAKYDGIDDYDSFISTRNMRSNLEKVKQIGRDTYKKELDEKIEILHILLEQYNDGRHKSPFCTAVNLVDLDSLRQIIEQSETEVTAEMTPKERAALVTAKLNAAAAIQGVSLKMRKKK